MTTPPPDASPPDVPALREALRAVIDPEAGVNIVDLGLVYDLELRDGAVRVLMTMTSPACPMGDMIRDEVEEVLAGALPEGTSIDVEITFSPPWDPSMMSDAARRIFE